MTLLFWGCAAYVVYAYVGFPLLTILRGRFRPRPYRRAEIEPSVSLLVAAYNEAGVIEDRIRNALALDYPPERLEIVVASDGSDDGTNEIVRRYANGRVRLLELGRVGKAAALNAAITKGDVVKIPFMTPSGQFSFNCSITSEATYLKGTPLSFP